MQIIFCNKNFKKIKQANKHYPPYIAKSTTLTMCRTEFEKLRNDLSGGYSPSQLKKYTLQLTTHENSIELKTTFNKNDSADWFELCWEFSYCKKRFSDKIKLIMLRTAGV